MKPQQTVPLLATLAPAAAVSPAIVVGVIAGALLWLLSTSDKGGEQIAQSEIPRPAPPNTSEHELKGLTRTKRAARRVTREDLAEALAYGARRFSRKEAVAALETLGFRKTAAYKALSIEGKFSGLIEFNA